MQTHHADTRHSDQHGRPYVRLGAMLVLSFLAMYALMYAMVDRWQNVHNNLNQAWMAGLMVAPMLVIELALMWRMYPHAGSMPCCWREASRWALPAGG